jgi:opacity protein-like surface antigen
MRGTIRGLAACLAVPLLAVGAAWAGSGEAHVFFGPRSIEDDRLDAAAVDDPVQVGAGLSFEVGLPVMLALELAFASSDGTDAQPTEVGDLSLDTEVDTVELDVGIRKVWGQTHRLFAGIGLAWISLDVAQTESGTLGSGVDFTDTIVDDSGSDIGLWLSGGYARQLGESLSMGAEVRYSNAEVDVEPTGATGETVAIDAGGLQYGLRVAYHW